MNATGPDDDLQTLSGSAIFEIDDELTTAQWRETRCVQPEGESGVTKIKITHPKENQRSGNPGQRTAVACLTHGNQEVAQHNPARNLCP